MGDSSQFVGLDGQGFALTEFVGALFQMFFGWFVAFEEEHRRFTASPFEMDDFSPAWPEI
jgi:hypothetical protein